MVKGMVAELRRDGWGEKRKLHEEEEENDLLARLVVICSYCFLPNLLLIAILSCNCNRTVNKPQVHP